MGNCTVGRLIFAMPLVLHGFVNILSLCFEWSFRCSLVGPENTDGKECIDAKWLNLQIAVIEWPLFSPLVKAEAYFKVLLLLFVRFLEGGDSSSAYHLMGQLLDFFSCTNRRSSGSQEFRPKQV